MGGQQCSHPTRQDESGSANEAKKGKKKKALKKKIKSGKGKSRRQRKEEEESVAVQLGRCYQWRRNVRSPLMLDEVFIYYFADPATGNAMLFSEGNFYVAVTNTRGRVSFRYWDLQGQWVACG